MGQLERAPSLSDEAYVLRPGETLADALLGLKASGARTILLPAGFHVLGATGPGWKRGGPGQDAEVTVRPLPGVPREAVTLGYPDDGSLRSFRPYCRVRYEDVRVDFAGLNQFYEGVVGFDRCEWFNGRGWADGRKRLQPVRGGYYFRGGWAHDLLYGPVGADEVSDSRIERISGDVLQRTRVVRDVEIDTVDGSVLPHHTDLFQFWGGTEGVVIERVRATNIGPNVQAFMFESFIGRDADAVAAAGPFAPRWTHRNMVVRDVTVEMAPVRRGGDPNWGGPPFSHLMGYFDHCLFERVRLPAQRVLVRDQFGRGGCRAVRFVACDLHPGSTLDRPGVEVLD